MRDQLRDTEILLSTILNQRNVLYDLKIEEHINRQDLEVLAFSKVQRFFSSYQLHKHYPHANVQVLKRSLRKLYDLHLLQSIRPAKGSTPTCYAISSKGKMLLEKYCQLMFAEQTSG